MSLTFPGTAGGVKVGDYIVLDGCPCKVNKAIKSKPGKHGHAKIGITGKDIYTGATKSICHASHIQVDLFTPQKTEYVLSYVNAEQGFIEVLDEKGKACAFDFDSKHALFAKMIQAEKEIASTTQDVLVTVLQTPRGIDDKIALHAEVIEMKLD